MFDETSVVLVKKLPGGRVDVTADRGGVDRQIVKNALRSEGVCVVSLRIDRGKLAVELTGRGIPDDLAWAIADSAVITDPRMVLRDTD